MDLTEAMELFKEIKKRFEKHAKDFSEFRTRILLIDPVLRLLGWDVENPDFVVLEYQPTELNRKSADYVLKNNGKNVAIVEAKNIDIDIEYWEHREQADGYARYAEVKFFVLTNGIKWLLYERDLMTSLESLKPIVRFDVVHDEPYQCALAAISMWKPNLAFDDGPSEAVEPLLISPETASNQSISQPDEQEERQLSDSSPEDSDNWCTFERKMYPQGTTPIRLKIGTDIDETVKYWLDVIHKVVAWLIDEERLSVNARPIKIGKQIFIGREAVNPDGTPFKIQRQLPKRLILQRSITTVLQWQGLRRLLQQLDVDLSSIRVSHT